MAAAINQSTNAFQVSFSKNTFWSWLLDEAAVFLWDWLPANAKRRPIQCQRIPDCMIDTDHAHCILNIASAHLKRHLCDGRVPGRHAPWGCVVMRATSPKKVHADAMDLVARGANSGKEHVPVTSL